MSDPSRGALPSLQRDFLRLCVESAMPPDARTRLGDTPVWQVYRNMVRRRLLGELKVAYRRTHTAAGDALFEAAFDHYMQVAPPRARFFHRIPATFEAPAVAYFRDAATGATTPPQNTASGARIPPYLPDLVRFEAARWAVSDLDDRVPAPEDVGELSFDGAPVISPALRLLALDHAVHRQPAPDAGDYASGRVYLALHRAQDDAPVRVWTLNRVGFALLTELQTAPASMTAAIQALALRLKISIDDAFLEGLCDTLATFVDRRILFGSRAPRASKP